MSFFNNYNELSLDEIENYIYKDVNIPSSKNGISSGNNLITILVESLEWFYFINDTSSYPNGANIIEDKLDILFSDKPEFKERILKGDSEAISMIGHISQAKISPHDIVDAYEKGEVEGIYKRAKMMIEMEDIYKELTIAYYKNSSRDER